MKEHLTKTICALVALLAATMLLGGCDGLERSATVPPYITAGYTGAQPQVSPSSGADEPSPGALPAPESTLGAQQGVEYRTATVYYPEDATADNAQFILECTLPVFGEAFPAFEAMNSAVSEYEEELLERVSAERLPYADAAQGAQAPYTRVSCAVESCGGYVNIYLNEATSFGGDEELLPRALVLGPDGARCSLYSATGRFDAEAVAAQQVFNLIDANRDAYYGDITLEDVPAALDLYAGFFLTVDGYGLSAAPGTLAPESEGVQTFFIDREAFYPDVVGDVLESAEYEALARPLNTLAAACGIDYAGFTGGSPSAYAASAFMTLTLTDGTEDMLYVPVESAQYEETFKSFFTGIMPEDIAALGDGTYIDGEGGYMLPVYPHPAWSFRIDDAVRTKEGLTLYGMLLYGTPGSADAGELCAATVTLITSAASPMGYAFDSLELR